MHSRSLTGESTRTGYAMPSGKSGSKNCEQKRHTCTRLYMEIVWSSRRTSLETRLGSQVILHRRR